MSDPCAICHRPLAADGSCAACEQWEAEQERAEYAESMERFVEVEDFRNSIRE